MGKTIGTEIKRIASFILAMVLLISVMPTAFADPFEKYVDFPTGWSKPAMEAAVRDDLLVGRGNSTIAPKDNLTRAEMAAVMVRAFGATTYTSVSQFKDLDINQWYYNSIASAVKMGAIVGKSNTEMGPNDYITREEVFSILSRILALESDNVASLSKFHDGDDVSAWALTTVIPLVERGYVKGDNNGYLNPKANITREEFAQIMYTTIKRYITAPGTYEEDMDGIVVLRCGNVTLKNMTVTGDLVVGDGAAKNTVNLENITVDGRLLTRGGTITIKSSAVNYGVVVLNPNGITIFRNYRVEDVFKNIIEHTIAGFLTNTGGSQHISGGYEKSIYTVIFKLYDSDQKAYEEIEVYSGETIGDQMPADPTADQIPGKKFNGWKDEKGNRVTRDTVVNRDMTVIADLTSTNDKITVTFWNSYSSDNKKELDSVVLTLNDEGKASVPAEDILDLKEEGYFSIGYEKIKFTEDSYPDHTGVYHTIPQFWYIVDGKLVKFDETAVLTKDTDVYMMSKKFSVITKLEDGSEISVSTKYSDSDRVMDSGKNLMNSMIAWMESAKLQNNPVYVNATDKTLEILESKKIIDENKNIKKIHIPLLFSSITTKAIANNMVNDHIQDMIKDEEGKQLDQLIEMVGVAELVSLINKGGFIDSLDPEAIVDIIKNNRDTVIGLIMADLHSGENSELIDMVLAHVSQKLEDDEKLREALAEDLIKTIAGDGEDAADLRKFILKSNSLASVLENEYVKEEAIKHIINVENDVLDAIIKNADNDTKKKIIKEISEYSTFISEIVKTSSFRDYILGLICYDESEPEKSEYENFSKLLKNDVSKRQILGVVEKSKDLKDLLRNNTDVRKNIISSINIEDDVLRYVCAIEGATDYSDIIKQDEIEAYFKTIPEYLMCTTDEEKKQFKNSVYNNSDSTEKEKALENFNSQISKYKENVLTSFADDNLKNENIIKMIEDKMIDFVQMYIDDPEKIDEIDEDLRKIIEDNIINYVAELITGATPTDPVLKDVKESLDADMDEFIATAHLNDTVLAAIENFVRNHEDDEMKQHIGNVYYDLTGVLAKHINGLDEESEVYMSFDGTLKAAATPSKETGEPAIPIDVVADIIKNERDNENVLNILKQYIQDKEKYDEDVEYSTKVKGYINSFIDSIDKEFVENNKDEINTILSRMDLEGFVNTMPDDAVGFIKNHIAKLGNDTAKETFANRIFDTISETQEYKDVMDDLFIDNELEIVTENVTILTVLSLTIRNLKLDEALKFTKNDQIKKIVDLIGKDFIEKQYETVRDNYCDGLDNKIALVESETSNRETYTTSLIFILDPIYILEKVYGEANQKMIEKLQSLNVYYGDGADDNRYLYYLVEGQDIIENLFEDTGIETEEHTAYQLRSAVDYANYMMELIIAIDDALCWYGDKLTESERQAVYDAVFDKAYNVSDKIDEILEDYNDDGKLPDEVEAALQNVKQINDIFVKFESRIKSIIDKYLETNLHGKIDDETLGDSDKIQSAVDIMLGADDPVFTLDSLYDIFYHYDDTMQAKLKQLVDTKKLDTAIAKFKASAAGQKIDEAVIDGIYNVIKTIANQGFDSYIDEDAAGPDVVDQYIIPIVEKKITIIIKRTVE